MKDGTRKQFFVLDRYDFVSKALKIIAFKDPTIAFHYCLKRRKSFPECEPAIAKNRQYSYEYSILILKKRFRLGEPAICRNRAYAEAYAHWWHMEFEQWYRTNLVYNKGMELK